MLYNLCSGLWPPCSFKRTLSLLIYQIMIFNIWFCDGHEVMHMQLPWGTAWVYYIIVHGLLSNVGGEFETYNYYVYYMYIICSYMYITMYVLHIYSSWPIYSFLSSRQQRGNFLFAGSNWYASWFGWLRIHRHNYNTYRLDETLKQNSNCESNWVCLSHHQFALVYIGV